MSLVTLEEMKAHMILDPVDDEEAQKQLDMKIKSFIEQAQAAAEDFCKCFFSEDDVPEPVRLAIMLYVSHFYEFRDNYDKQSYVSMRMAFESLLWPYRDVTKMF